jgi:acyl-coenzyme A synthetase/AMP-(fatty) acid ligase
MVSIGKPLANVKAVIIDEQDDVITTFGEKGELCVAGDHVTPGYWNNEVKNASAFFVMDGKRFYHTGDLCFWDASGNIMYVGRLDQQVKIQGFRVELAEIEHYVRQYYRNEIRIAAVAFKNANNLDEIALFVEKSKEASDGLIAFLKEKMPQYMIPSRIVYLENFPQNSSDKIDRKMMLNQIKC